MTNEIEYIVSFSSEYPNVIEPASTIISFEGPLHRSLMTVYPSACGTTVERAAKTMEHVLQNQPNVRWFRRTVRIMETDLPEYFSERYNNKREALKQARKVGADIIVQESDTRRGNVYFLVTWDAQLEAARKVWDAQFQKVAPHFPALES